jgi:ABC-type lipoprotein export system ATPase subunit/GNAT superfamily N-acetyltransferase
MTEWMPLKRKTTPRVSSVVMDDITRTLITPFDYDSDGTEEFYPYEVPFDLPLDWGIGVIVGASGTGKSTLLRDFGKPEKPEWNDSRSIASHFPSAEDASELLAAAGLMSIPEWVKPYNVLSNGQQFRADLARSIKNGAVIDEFTSVVDRNVAKAASTAMSRYVRKNGVRNIVLATVHRDVLEFLEPDWVIDTDKGSWTNGRWLHRPELALTIYPSHYSVWDYFAPYHYLTGKINRSAHCYVGIWEGQLVAFNSCITAPNGNYKNAYRGHRLVIHPDYQGFGFGPKISEAVAQHYIDNGKRYFAKTAHPRLGGYRDSSPLWKPTSKNHMKRKDGAGNTRWEINPDRWTFSHEYIGVS